MGCHVLLSVLVCITTSSQEEALCTHPWHQGGTVYCRTISEQAPRVILMNFFFFFCKNKTTLLFLLHKILYTEEKILIKRAHSFPLNSCLRVTVPAGSVELITEIYLLSEDTSVIMVLLLGHSHVSEHSELILFPEQGCGVRDVTRKEAGPVLDDVTARSVQKHPAETSKVHQLIAEYKCLFSKVCNWIKINF